MPFIEVMEQLSQAVLRTTATHEKLYHNRKTRKKKGKDIMGRRFEKRWHMTFNFSSSGIDYNFQIIREELGSI